MEEEMLGQGTEMDQGLDIEGQLRSGVEAFLQSGEDPALAVEIVRMLAEMMGIAPQLDPYANEDPSQVAAAQAPMASAGMRLYKNGGKIQKFEDGGKPGDPKKPYKRKVTSQLAPARTIQGPKFFTPQDLNSGSVKERYSTPGLVTSLNEKQGKGSLRRGIQDAGLSGGNISQAGGYMIGDRVAYDFGNRKGELAGQFKSIPMDIPAFEHDLPVPQTDLIDITPDVPLTPPPMTTQAPKKKVGKLKPMDMTYGGSDRKGNPANKFGLGTKGGFKRRRTDSFPKR